MINHCDPVVHDLGTLCLTDLSALMHTHSDNALAFAVASAVGKHDLGTKRRFRVEKLTLHNPVSRSS